MAYSLHEVNDNPDLKRDFLHLPIKLYKNNPYWIRPLDKDIEDVFDPKANKYFRHGECTRWVLKKNGETVGRVAAFIDRKTCNTFEQPTGGMGFFECIDDKQAAFTLFDACKKWLEERNMEAMDGPINFGDRDKWWGLLIDGESEPNYCMPYTHKYYIPFFEEYGFKVYFNQFTYYRPVSDGLTQKLYDKFERVIKDPNFSFKHLTKKDLDKFTEDFRTVYNEAWGKHTGVKGMASAQAKAIMQKIKPVLDERLIWFAYYGERPVAFFIMLPELNQIFKHVNGKLDLVGKIKFLWYRYVVGVKKMFGVAFGVVPDFQGKGVEGAIIVACSDLIQNRSPYKEFEMNWIGDFNPKMMHLVETVGGRIKKIHATYRLLFDPTKPFSRCPEIK